MKLSIVIPAYRTGRLIETAVNSVTRQSFANWEMIIVDDGSQDDTPGICDSLAASDPRIRVIHTANQGAYMARLTGARAARGEWVMFMDSDDSITEECIEGLFTLAGDDVDIAVGTININNQRVYRHGIEGKIDTADYIEAILLSRTTIGNYSKLFRRSLFDGITPPTSRITNNEDMLLLLSLAANASRVTVDNHIVCYNYIFREGSARTLTMSPDKWQLLFDTIRTITDRMKSDRLETARLRMILDRTYGHMVLRGIFPAPDAPFMRELDNLSPRDISGREREILAVLRSPLRQRVGYWRFTLLTGAKKIVKKIIGRR